MPTLELNPILVREVRARWRKWPAFAVVFGFATLLAGMVYWRYASFTSGDEAAVFSRTRGAQLGRDLFVTLATTQAVGWMLLAPLLTATGLMQERELGLLEAVHLSELSATQVVGGKVLSMLAFASLMLLAPMPIVAVCFLLGGVSPFELVATTLICFMMALTAGLIGLNCAAWNYDRSSVLGKTLMGLMAWTILPGSVFVNPIAMLYLLLSDDPTPACYLLGSLLGCAVLALCIYRKAEQGLSRPIWQQQSESPRTPLWPELPYSVHLSHDRAYAEPELVEELRMRRRQQLPLVSRLRFANPLMLHEVRRTLRPLWAGFIRSAYDDARSACDDARENMTALGILLVGCCFLCSLPILIYAFVVYNLAVYACVTWLGLAMILLLGTTRGAEAFARERELHTWEGLRLTSLSPQQIIAGKLGAILFTSAYYSLPVLLGMSLCVRSVSFSASSILLASDMIALPQWIGAILVGAAAVWCYAAFAMLVSWLCRRSWVAIAWSLACPFLAAVALVVIGRLSETNLVGTVALHCNPWAALADLQDASSVHGVCLDVTRSAGAMVLLGTCCLLLLYGLMGRDVRGRCNLPRRQLS